jgi:hypothetical protein
MRSTLSGGIAHDGPALTVSSSGGCEIRTREGLHPTRSPSQQIEVSDDSTTGPTQRLTDWMRFVASGPVRRPLLLGLPVDQPILVFGSAVQGERSESRSDGVAALDRRTEDQQSTGGEAEFYTGTLGQCTWR